jgi:molecular chaperone DnaK (HSP70)
MPDAIAIDFGTTRTKTAYWDERAHSPRLVRLGYGDEPFVPSLFYLPRGSEQILWGYDAEEYLEEDPAGIVDVLKRRLQDRYVFANRRKISPKALLTLMFRRLREQVGQEVLALQGTPPGKAVMTLPALYGPAVEKLLREAAQAAAFTEVELVPEPVAAAQAWLVQTEETVRSVGVLDCGGGTLDLAYLGYEHGQFRIIPECPPGGDTHVGGHDVDRELMNLLREQMPEAAEELAQRQPFYLRQVRVLKERYCRGLPLRPLRVSGQTLELDAQDIQAVLEERFIAQTCESLKAYLGRVVALTGGEPPPVLLVGGSARIKGLREAVEAQVGCQALWWERSEFATVLGAVSTSVSEPRQTLSPLPEPQPAPPSHDDTSDEVSVLEENVGIETLGGILTPFFEKGMTLPAKTSQTFSTAEDNQEALEVHILAGNSSVASEAKSLGRFGLTNLPPAPRDVPQIEITFEITKDGVLIVRAVDKATSSTEQVTIQGIDISIKRKRDCKGHEEPIENSQNLPSTCMHILKHAGTVTSVGFSPDGRLLATGSKDDTIKLWNPEDGRELRSFATPDNNIYSLAFSPAGRLLATGGEDGFIRFWNPEDGRELRSLATSGGAVYSLAFSPDGRLLASGNYSDNAVKLWEPDSGRELCTLDHGGSVYAVAISPDGRLLVSAGYYHIKLWDIQTARKLRVLSGHTGVGIVTSIAISPNGRLLASGGLDHTVKLWELETGREINTLTGHGGSGFWGLMFDAGLAVAFAPDGRYLASGGGDGMIKLWSLETGKELGALSGHTNWIYSVAFSPDGRFLASGSVDNTARLWS